MHENRVEMVLKAFMARSPSDRERAMPAFGHTQPLFALPDLKNDIPKNFADIEDSVVLIEVEIRPGTV